jgi:hypothetical protein
MAWVEQVCNTRRHRDRPDAYRALRKPGSTTPGRAIPIT